MTFQEKLKRLTQDRRLNVVARRAGIAERGISNYLAKPQNPRSDIALRLAKVLGVDVAWLIDDVQDWPPVRVTQREIVEQYAA